MRGVTLAIVIVLLWPLEAGAIDARGKYTTYGAGSVGCNQWLRSRKLKDTLNERDQHWVAGYVTAYNRWVSKERSIIPELTPNRLYDMVDRFCEENPLQSLAGAAESVILELIRTR